MDAIFGLFGFFLVLVVIALLLRKRTGKRRAFEAEFRDMSGREFGEFECKMSTIRKEEPEYSYKASFGMRHESLEKGQTVQVYLGDLLVMRGKVKRAGRIFLRESAVVSAVKDPEPGQVCRVVWSGIEQFRAPIKPD